MLLNDVRGSRSTKTQTALDLLYLMTTAETNPDAPVPVIKIIWNRFPPRMKSTLTMLYNSRKQSFVFAQKKKDFWLL